MSDWPTLRPAFTCDGAAYLQEPINNARPITDPFGIRIDMQAIWRGAPDTTAIVAACPGPMPPWVRRELARTPPTGLNDPPRPVLFWSADGSTWDDFMAPEARKERRKLVVAAKLTERRLHKRRANRARKVGGRGR